MLSSISVRRNWVFLIGISVLMSVALMACDKPTSAAVASAELPEPRSAGAEVLKNFCGDCHGPPPPSTHKRDEWANVVYRMQNHRVMSGMDAVPEHEYQRLLVYLEKYASP